MEPFQISIDCEATGQNIKRLIKEKGYKIHEIQQATGLSDYRSVYKWFRGENLPSVENMLILCILLQMHIDDMLVTHGVKESFFECEGENVV